MKSYDDWKTTDEEHEERVLAAGNRDLFMEKYVKEAMNDTTEILEFLPIFEVGVINERALAELVKKGDYEAVGRLLSSYVYSQIYTYTEQKYDRMHSQYEVLEGYSCVSLTKDHDHREERLDDLYREERKWR